MGKIKQWNIFWSHYWLMGSNNQTSNILNWRFSHSSLNMVNLTSFSQMSPENGEKWDWPGDKWDWLGTFEIDQSIPIVPWGHLRFTSKSHLSLDHCRHWEPESKYIYVQPPLRLTEKWDWLVNLKCPQSISFVPWSISIVPIFGGHLRKTCEIYHV